MKWTADGVEAHAKTRVCACVELTHSNNFSVRCFDRKGLCQFCS